MSPSRRSVLATAAALPVAGCIGSDPGATSTPTPTTGPTRTATETVTATPTPEPPEIDAVDGDWPMDGFDAGRTRFDPDGSLPGNPRVAWESEYGSEMGSVLVADGTVYVDAGPALRAFDAATGDRKWSRTFDADYLVGPAVAGGTLYVGVGTEVRALDADGSDRWSVDVERGHLDSLVPADGSAYATTRGTREADGVVAAVADGERRWTFDPDGDDLSPGRFGDLAVDGAGVYAVAEGNGSGTRHVALDVDGESRWTARGLNHSGALTAADGTLYAGGYYGTVVAHDTDDGTERWRSGADHPVGAIAAADGTVYVATTTAEGVIRAIDGGVDQWRVDGGGAPYVVGDALLQHTMGELRAYDREDRTERWRRSLDVVGLAVAGGVVFAACGDGRLRALA